MGFSFLGLRAASGSPFFFLFFKPVKSYSIFEYCKGTFKNKLTSSSADSPEMLCSLGKKKVKKEEDSAGYS